MSMSIFGIASRLLLAWAVVLGLLLPQSLPAQQAPPPQQAGPPPQAQQQRPPAPDPHSADEKTAEGEALGFLRYLDQGRYSDSYAYTSTLLRSKADQVKFAAEIRKDRAPAGDMQSRRLIDASYTVTLPHAPTGQYVVLRYGTVFAKKTSALETITMSYESGYWRVAGWFLK